MYCFLFKYKTPYIKQKKVTGHLFYKVSELVNILNFSFEIEEMTELFPCRLYIGSDRIDFTRFNSIMYFYKTKNVHKAFRMRTFL